MPMREFLNNLPFVQLGAIGLSALMVISLVLWWFFVEWVFHRRAKRKAKKALRVAEAQRLALQASALESSKQSKPAETPDQTLPTLRDGAKRNRRDDQLLKATRAHFHNAGAADSVNAAKLSTNSANTAKTSIPVTRQTARDSEHKRHKPAQPNQAQRHNAEQADSAPASGNSQTPADANKQAWTPRQNKHLAGPSATTGGNRSRGAAEHATGDNTQTPTSPDNANQTERSNAATSNSSIAATAKADKFRASNNTNTQAEAADHNSAIQPTANISADNNPGNQTAKRVETASPQADSARATQAEQGQSQSSPSLPQTGPQTGRLQPGPYNPGTVSLSSKDDSQQGPEQSSSASPATVDDGDRNNNQSVTTRPTTDTSSSVDQSTANRLARTADQQNTRQPSSTRTNTNGQLSVNPDTVNQNSPTTDHKTHQRAADARANTDSPTSVKQDTANQPSTTADHQTNHQTTDTRAPANIVSSVNQGAAKRLSADTAKQGHDQSTGSPTAPTEHFRNGNQSGLQPGSPDTSKDTGRLTNPPIASTGQHRSNTTDQSAADSERLTSGRPALLQQADTEKPNPFNQGKANRLSQHRSTSGAGSADPSTRDSKPRQTNLPDDLAITDATANKTADRQKNQPSVQSENAGTNPAIKRAADPENNRSLTSADDSSPANRTATPETSSEGTAAAPSWLTRQADKAPPLQQVHTTKIMALKDTSDHAISASEKTLTSRTADTGKYKIAAKTRNTPAFGDVQAKLTIPASEIKPKTKNNSHSEVAGTAASKQLSASEKNTRKDSQLQERDALIESLRTQIETLKQQQSATPGNSLQGNLSTAAGNVQGGPASLSTGQDSSTGPGNDNASPADSRRTDTATGLDTETATDPQQNAKTTHSSEHQAAPGTTQTAGTGTASGQTQNYENQYLDAIEKLSLSEKKLNRVQSALTRLQDNGVVEIPSPASKHNRPSLRSKVRVLNTGGA